MTGRCSLCRRPPGAAATRCRFSLRRRTPPTRDADHTADFEPMLDFDRPAPVSPPSFPQPERSAAPDPAAPHRRDAAATPPEVSEPTGVIRFETDADAQTAAPEPVQTSGPEAPRHARIRRARPVEPPAPADEAPLPDVPQGRTPHRRCWTMTSPTSPRILTPPPSPPRRLPMTPPRPRARAPALRTLPALQPSCLTPAPLRRPPQKKAARKNRKKAPPQGRKARERAGAAQHQNRSP